MTSRRTWMSMGSRRIHHNFLMRLYTALCPYRCIPMHLGFMDPSCFVSEGDSRDFVGRFVDYLLLIAKR